jgi:hypothetical protein
MVGGRGVGAELASHRRAVRRIALAVDVPEAGVDLLVELIDDVGGRVLNQNKFVTKLRGSRAAPALRPRSPLFRAVLAFQNRPTFSIFA